MSVVNTVFSKEPTVVEASILDSEFANLSGVDLLEKAKKLKSSEESMKFKLISEALRLSKYSNDQVVQAKSHKLLGEIARKAKNKKQSSHHFLQASILYKRLNDNRNYITSSINYIKALTAQKRYEQVTKLFHIIRPVAIENKEALLIGLTYIAQADSYYEQKKYTDAIRDYNQSLEYLLGDDKILKKHLGTTYKKMAQSYKRLKNRKRTAYYYEKALETFTELQNKKLIARTLNTLAEAERYLGNFVTALNYSIRGLEIHKTIDDPAGYAKASMGAGIIYRHIESYEKSLKHVYDAYLYYKKVNDTSGIAKTSNQMGLLYTRIHEFEQAKSFYEETINLPQKNIEAKTLASALREMAVISLESGDYEAAKKYAMQAGKTYEKEKNKSMRSVTNRIIANVYRAQNDKVNAIIYYRKSLALANEINNKLYQIKTQTPLAGLLIGKNTDEAISLLEKSLKQAIQIESKSHRLFAYRELRTALKERGNITESLRYAEEEIALTLIIKAEEEKKELVLAKANLFSHKKEMELEALKEIARQDQLELAKKSSEIEISEKIRTISELELIKNKYASIALACLLFICVMLVIFIYRRFKVSKKRNKELDYLASRDPLTNCFNRRVLFEVMDKYFEAQDSLDEYCIIMIDIDNFKGINDNYGHSAGDAVLCSVANIIQENVRKNDIAARFGGEEFCILLHQVSQSKAMQIAETMRQEVENSQWEEICVTCSFGVSSIRFNAKEPSELIDQADLALYRSKSLGRNKVSLWNDTLN